ncbi:GlxA family transcriptional regulator [Actinomadura welshii]|uniref:GlxA family transcriptional regulator n=1 Tax=Actinomadura welshii TaxID=3103817 RepID=UPI0003ACE548|nr:helix-turn-helix domain-containing protein [Actinomadura madurae]
MDERLMVVVGYDRAQLLDIACVTSTLIEANWGANPPYRVRLATPGGGPITCTDGMTLHGQESLERLRGPLDTLIVSGGLGYQEAAADRRFVGHVRRLAKESRRVASVCTGSAVLAAAGLLDGRHAATHWMWVDKIAKSYPKVTFDPEPIYIRDGDVATSAGVTSALDLTLAFIEEDHGPDLARGVARLVVTYLQRPGNQAQMSMFVATAPPPEHSLVRRITDHVASNLDGDLSTAALAPLAGVSQRHLTRLFLEHLGRTPGRYVRQARTEAAAHLLATTTHPLTSVARRCGFGSAETLRQAFVDLYGIAPSRYRSAHSR